MKKGLLSLALFLTVNASVATTWKMATPYSEGWLAHKVNVFFAKQVAAETGDEIIISVHTDEELAKHEQTLMEVKFGDKAQVGEVLGSIFAKEHPVWELDSLPFLADSYEKAEKLWKVSRENIEKDLESQGLVLLYAVHWPGQNFFTKEKIDDISSLEGQKIIAYSESITKIAEKLKAIPVKIVKDIDVAFKNGMYDMSLMEDSSLIEANIWNHTKYHTRVSAFFPRSLIFVSKKEWDKLDKKTQSKIQKAAHRAEDHAWTLSKVSFFSDEAVLTEKGMISEKPNKSVKQSFYKIGQQLTNEWHKNASKKDDAVLKAFRGY